VLKKLLVLAAPLLMALPASAGLLSFTLDQSLLDTPPGGIYQPAACQNIDGSGACVIFTGQIVFDDSDFYTLTGMQLDFDASNPDGGGVDVLDNNFGNYFFLNVPGTMGKAPASDTYSGGVFEVDVEPTAPSGDYFGTAMLQYQDSLGGSFQSNPVSFEVTVTPEPGMFALAGAGLAMFARLRRRRRVA
jgi:MYXO-CTERM domain-containing protein